MMVALRFSETVAVTRVTWCNIPEDGILHSHRRENFKSYWPEFLDHNVLKPLEMKNHISN
jgi:hypothetical protein